MKARARLSRTIGAIIVIASALVQRHTSAQPTRQPELATVLPAGALLVVEAKDLSAIVAGWNASSEKARWLSSANYQTFSRSRLFLRLKDAFDEFTTAAGVPADMALVSDIAGGESALALYDIGKLEFLYVTRLASAKAMENALWRERGNYEPRAAAGTPFYVRADGETKRLVAFAARDDYLLLATREDLLAGALTRLAAQPGSSVAGEGWYAQATAAPRARGDVRLVMNLESIVKQPHFRSYWIQDNVAEMKQYTSAIADLFLTPTDVREERVLLRAEDKPSATPAAPLGELTRLVPDNAGLYRVWAAPSTEVATQMVVSKVLAPRGSSVVSRDRAAPQVALTSGVTGSGADLETRIDQEPPTPPAIGYQVDTLTRFIGAQPLSGLLQVESTRAGADAVFVNRGVVLVVARGSDWPAGAARDAIRDAIAPVWTKAGLDLRWSDVQVGTQSLSQLEGLEPLAVAERGRLLFIANDPVLLSATLDAASRPMPTLEASYAAGFRHGLERERFAGLTRLVDHASSAGESREPAFFSENLVSLSQTLARVDSASIVVRDGGARVSETVTYRLVP